MKPRKPTTAEKSQLQLFQARLDSQINLDHPRVVVDTTIQEKNITLRVRAIGA